MAFCAETPAGYCWAVSRRVPLENASDDGDRGYIVLIGVRPEFRRRGIGAALLDQAEVFLKECGAAGIWISPYAPGYFTPGVDETYANGLKLLAKRGYAATSRPLAMQLSFEKMSIPEHIKSRQASIEREFEFTSFQPFHAIPLIRFAECEFSGDWVRFARDAAKDILRGDDPGRLQIASVNGIVVGYSHYENGRFGPIGVSKGVEGRGIGSILMARTLSAMRSAGFEKAWFMWTDDATAERFYAPWGWKEWRRFSIMTKHLI